MFNSVNEASCTVSQQLKGSEDEMKQELVTNRSTNSAAIYHLLSARLARSVLISSFPGSLSIQPASHSYMNLVTVLGS